jgi:hypothetical protein
MPTMVWAQMHQNNSKESVRGAELATRASLADRTPVLRNGRFSSIPQSLHFVISDINAQKTGPTREVAHSLTPRIRRQPCHKRRRKTDRDRTDSSESQMNFSIEEYATAGLSLRTYCVEVKSGTAVLSLRTYFLEARSATAVLSPRTNVFEANRITGYSAMTIVFLSRVWMVWREDVSGDGSLDWTSMTVMSGKSMCEGLRRAGAGIRRGLHRV